MEYSAHVYKADRRCATGKRLVTRVDHVGLSLDQLTEQYSKQYPASKGYEVDFRETYIERTNLMSGKKFIERYDRPLCCSPASETYWQM